MTIYYLVNLEVGIKTEEQKQGHYSGSPELNVTVFKSLRAAKRKFDQITKDEIARLKDMRLSCRAIGTRREAVSQ